jgi:hypothetical protein
MSRNIEIKARIENVTALTGKAATRLDAVKDRNWPKPVAQVANMTDRSQCTRDI